MRISAEITDIDYEKTVDKILPVLRNKAAEKDDRGFAVRLFLRLSESDAGKKSVAGILDCLSGSDKANVICGLINNYSYMLTGKVNEALGHRLPQIRTGSITAGVSGSTVTIYADNVSVDLPALMNDPNIADTVNRKASEYLTERLGPLAGAVAGRNAAALIQKLVSLSPETAQSIAAQALNSGKYTDVIADVVSGAVAEWAVIKIGMIHISDDMRDANTALPALPDMGSKVWEDKLIEAVAEYIEKVVG